MRGTNGCGMDALVIGGSGFVGRHIAAALGRARCLATYCGRPAPDAVQFDAVNGRLRDLIARSDRRFTHAIVLYGMIDMEGCAREPVRAGAVNVDSAIGVLEDALAAGIMPVYVSTDYVFDGTRALWSEADVAVPRMAYGAQKLAVERWLGRTGAPHLIVRFSKVVSGDTGTHSMLGQWVNDIRAGGVMRCADDQFFSPAFVEDIAGATIKLAESGATGLYHVAGPERFSRIGLLRLLVDKVRAVAPEVDPTIEPCGLHALPFIEARPLDTSLAIDKLQRTVNWPFRRMDALCEEVAAAHFDARAKPKLAAS